MIRPAVIHQAANLHPHHSRNEMRPRPGFTLVLRGASWLRGTSSGSQITSLKVMPGFVAPGIVAAHRRK
jgi:hypothetical protein